MAWPCVAATADDENAIFIRPPPGKVRKEISGRGQETDKLCPTLSCSGRKNSCLFCRLKNFTYQADALSGKMDGEEEGLSIHGMQHSVENIPKMK